MFTHRLDPSGGGAPRLSPGEESLFVEMVPPLRRVAMGGGSEIEGFEAGVEEVMGRSLEAEAMEDGDEDDDKGEESAVNRQTAMLSLDVLARVLGKRHQAAFVGVLDDVTEMVAGDGPGALPGEFVFACAYDVRVFSCFMNNGLTF